jgi:hypothetical protein
MPYLSAAVLLVIALVLSIGYDPVDAQVAEIKT